MNYGIRKILTAFLTVFLVTLLTFLLMRISPVDPATAYVKRHSPVATEEQIQAARVQLGLDKPLAVQYTNWIRAALHLDFGMSLGTGHDVTYELGKAIPTTLLVILFTAVLTLAGILITGCLSYWNRDKPAGKLLSGLSLAGVSIPPFFLATVSIDILAVKLGWISVAGNTGLKKYLPAAICLAVFGTCFYSQMLTSSLRREMNEDYAVFARCRGLSERRILYRHALPQAMIDLIPSIAQMLTLCLAGAAIIERIFSLSGIGYLMIDSVVKRDAPMIYGIVLFLAVMVVLFDALADILQHFLQKGQREEAFSE
ncbi:ABC transporter permease [Lachnospiraceae bacterium 54-53]